MSNDAVFKSCLQVLRDSGIDDFVVNQIEGMCDFYRDKYRQNFDENVKLRAENMELRGLVKNATTVPAR